MKIVRGILIVVLFACAVWLLLPLSKDVFHIGMVYPLPVIALFCFALAYPQKIKYLFNHFRMASLVVTAIICIGVIFAGSILSVMVYYSKIKPKSGCTVVILGCEVQGDTPSRMLYDRMNAALEYINQNPESAIIASGGKGNGENKSEAQAIKDYLVSKGVNENRIYLEDESESTYENIYRSFLVIQKNNLNKKLAIVTDEFHQFRASFFSQNCGLTSSAISCNTWWYLAPSYWTRELLAVGKALFLKN